MNETQVERLDRGMMRGRSIPDDVDRPDRQFRYIRIQMEQVEELRGGGHNRTGLALSLGMVAESLGELGWHDLALLVYLQQLGILRERPGTKQRQLGRLLTDVRDTLIKL